MSSEIKGDLKKGAWTHEEDIKLVTYIKRCGISNWRQMPKLAGLSRCGKSCRLRWVNYLNPCVKHGNFTKEEDDIIIQKHIMIGTRWSEIAASLPGRTDNQIKNRWHAHLKKRSNNINLVESTESQKDTFIWDYDNSSQEESIEAYTNMISFSAPAEPSKPEGFEVPILMSPDTLNTGTSSSFIPTLEDNYGGTFNTSEDPYISFWREPFSLDDVCMENDHAGEYVYPGFELPMSQDWCHEAMIPYDSYSYI